MKKKKIIKKIRKVINDEGSINLNELELGSNPLKASFSNANVDVLETVEHLYLDDVETITYVNDQDYGYNSYTYEELSKDILLEILEAVDYYLVEQEKTMKRISN